MISFTVLYEPFGLVYDVYVAVNEVPPPKPNPSDA
jgi:hypothetical protein